MLKDKLERLEFTSKDRFESLQSTNTFNYKETELKFKQLQQQIDSLAERGSATKDVKEEMALVHDLPDFSIFMTQEDKE